METHWIVVISVLCTLCVCAQTWLAFYYRGHQYWFDRQSNKFNAEAHFYIVLLIGVPWLSLVLIAAVFWDLINKRLQIPFFFLYYFTDRYYKFSEEGLIKLNYDAKKLRNTDRIDHVIFRQAVKMVNQRFNYPIKIAR